MTADGSPLGALFDSREHEWNPDWQPIPAFPLVDAKFSAFKSDIEWVFNDRHHHGLLGRALLPGGLRHPGADGELPRSALKLTGAAPDAFTDDETSIHEPNINLVAKAGIATGCAAGKYCPTALVSREQMASFLARALKLSGSAPDAFTDDEQSIHEPNINLVAKAGVATGCGAGKHRPVANVTRGQMAAFLHRAFGPGEGRGGGERGGAGGAGKRSRRDRARAWPGWQGKRATVVCHNHGDPSLVRRVGRRNQPSGAAWRRGGRPRRSRGRWTWGRW